MPVVDLDDPVAVITSVPAGSPEWLELLIPRRFGEAMGMDPEQGSDLDRGKGGRQRAEAVGLRLSDLF